MQKTFPIRNAMENIDRALRLIKIINFNPERSLGPLSIEISLSSACNFNCYFCSSHSFFKGDKTIAQTLSDSAVSGLLEDVRRLNIREIRFSGNGEPFLCNRFREIIDTCKGRKIKIVTNGSRLNLVSADLFSKIHKLTISLNSIDNETHRLIHGYDGASCLPDIIENIERLISLPQGRQKLQINFAIGACNFEEMESLFQLSNRWNVFFAVRPVNAAFPGLESKILTPDQIENARAKIKKMLNNRCLSPNALASLKQALFYFQSYKPHESQKCLLPCYAGFYGAYITSGGDYQICCNCRTSMGNINTKRFSELWKDGQVYKTACEASLMGQKGVSVCSKCYSCPEASMYSRTFHKIFSKIPYQIKLLKRRIGV